MDVFVNNNIATLNKQPMNGIRSQIETIIILNKKNRFKA